MPQKVGKNVRKSENGNVGPFEIVVYGPRDEYAETQKLTRTLGDFIAKRHPAVYAALESGMGDIERESAQGSGQPIFNVRKL